LAGHLSWYTSSRKYSTQTLPALGCTIHEQFLPSQSPEDRSNVSIDVLQRRDRMVGVLTEGDYDGHSAASLDFGDTPANRKSRAGVSSRACAGSGCSAIGASADSHCALQLHRFVGRGRPLRWLAPGRGGQSLWHH